MKPIQLSIRLKCVLVLLFVLKSMVLKAEYEFKTTEDIYVIGDVHGAYEQLISTLKKQAIISEKGDWIAGKKHLVSLGDLLDRGADSRKVLDFFRKLQSQAENSGGKVHIVLGNHEVMNLKGDLRYVSKPEYLAFVDSNTKSLRKKRFKEFLRTYQLKKNKKSKKLFNKTFPQGFFSYNQAFSKNGKYGMWIQSLPFVIKINEQVFAHGGLSERVNAGSVAEINKKLHKSLEQYLSSWNKIAKKEKSRVFYPPFKNRFEITQKLKEDSITRQFLKTKESLLFSKYSPTWYRGNSLCHRFYESEKLANILERIGASRLWVGHTTTYDLMPHQRLDGQLIVMDTGMLKDYYGGQPFIATIKSDGSFRLFYGKSGKQFDSKPSFYTEGINPFNLSDKQTESILKSSKVMSKIDKSKKRPPRQIITLDYEGNKFKAAFLTTDEMPGMQLGDWKGKNATAKRYQYEIAAYKVDRMLGIGRVPVTIERTINGLSGALQVFIEDTITESIILSKYNGQLGVCSKSEQENLMDVFGYLIQNSIGRRADSYFTRKNGYLLFLENSRSFNPSLHFTSKSRADEAYVSSSFKMALLELTDDKLANLKPWLHSEQIKAVASRRDRLIGE